MAILQNARHERFAQNLVKGMSATEAYEKAGYKPNDQNAARLTRNDEVRARCAELMAPAVKATELSVERVLKELTRLAFYDMTAVLEVTDGKITMRDPASLPEDLRRAIVGIKPVEVGNDLQYECRFADKQKALDSLARRAIVRIKPVEVGDGLQYECKFADKQKALDSLARNLQMSKDMVIVENVFRVVNEMDDDELDRRLRELERAIGKATTLDPAAREGPARLH